MAVLVGSKGKKEGGGEGIDGGGEGDIWVFVCYQVFYY